jgi:hypothetical protein
MLWLALFLDLTTAAPGSGDAALYRQVLADHHLQGAYRVFAGGNVCKNVAQLSSDVSPQLYLAYVERNPGDDELLHATVQFSAVGRHGDTAWLQLRSFDAIYCDLYSLRSKTSFRLVREVRIPIPSAD